MLYWLALGCWILAASSPVLAVALGACLVVCAG